MSADRSAQAAELFARASRGPARGRLERAALALAIPANEQLSEQRRAHTLHILRDLFDGVENALRRSLSISLAAAGMPGRAAAADLGVVTAGLVWPRVEAAVLSPPLDLLDAALERASRHALSRRSSCGQVLAMILARNPDAELSQRATNLVVAASRELDGFGEPRLPFDTLDEPLANRVAWLAGAALRSYIVDRHPIDDSALDHAVQEAVRHFLAERREQPALHHAVSLASRLHTLGLLDGELLSLLAGDGEILLLAAALGRLARVSPRNALRALLSSEKSEWLILLRALELPTASMRAIASLLIADDDPMSPKACVKRAEAVSLADARRLLSRWQRDERYAAAIEALER